MTRFKSIANSHALAGPVRAGWVMVCALLMCVVLAGGCSPMMRRPLDAAGPPEMDFYRSTATEIDYPTTCPEPFDPSLATTEPRRLRHPRKDEIWNVSLAQAIHTALSNGDFLRDRAQFLSPRNLLLTNPDAAPSVYDPAIQETGVLIGGRGVEAALSDFDARLTTSMVWGRNEQVQNNVFTAGGLPSGATLQEDTANFSSRLEKTFANSGTFAISHDMNYLFNNQPAKLFPSAYSGSLRGEYRQPLWAGAGAEFTRIAGPIRQSLSGVSGVNQGVLVARINNDIALAEFESNVHNLLKDVEDAYWDLSLAYRTWDTEVTARNAALQTLNSVQAKVKQGLAGGGAADEAQARDAYFERKNRANNALADLYQAEAGLRRLLGLPVNDGRILRPSDEPTAAEFIPDWTISLSEALTHRVELRRQKWNIKSLELQLRASHSLTRPRLDFVSNYQVNGFGDNLISGNDDDGLTPQGYDSAYGSMTDGDQTGWNLGFEFSMPFGFRSAHAQVRNAELRLVKAKQGLTELEFEISHELGNAFQEIDRFYDAAQTNLNRLNSARDLVAATEAEYENDRTTLDLLVRARSSLAQTENAYYQSLIAYNKAITALHYRAGTLLEQDQVSLSESAWVPPAYESASRHAWERMKAKPDYSGKRHSEPYEFEVPEPFQPHPGDRPSPTDRLQSGPASAPWQPVRKTPAVSPQAPQPAPAQPAAPPAAPPNESGPTPPVATSPKVLATTGSAPVQTVQWVGTAQKSASDSAPSPAVSNGWKPTTESK